MTDLALTPQNDISAPALAREVAATRVLQLMVEEGLTQTDACKAVGIDQRAFYRHLSTMQSVLKSIQDETRGALLSGATLAVAGYLKGIQRLTDIVNDVDADKELVIKAEKELRAIVTQIAAVLPGAKPMTGDDEARPTTTKAPDITFTGPITFMMGQHDGVPTGTVLNGTATLVESSTSDQDD